MTPLSKAVTRVSSARDAGRSIVVILGPGQLIGFRLKGTRKVYETTLFHCYRLAVRAHVAAQPKKRKAKR